jgi:hypothetical protein
VATFVVSVVCRVVVRGFRPGGGIGEVANHSGLVAASKREVEARISKVVIVGVQERAFMDRCGGGFVERDRALEGIGGEGQAIVGNGWGVGGRLLVGVEGSKEQALLLRRQEKIGRQSAPSSTSRGHGDGSICSESVVRVDG